MLLKPDKAKKIFPGEQLSLVGPLDDARKAKKKKITLIVSLFLCIGLSIIFTVYRTVSRIISEKKYQKFEINFKLPNLKISTSANIDLDAEIDSVLQNNNGLWSFYVETLPKTMESFSWAKNRDQLFIDDSSVNITSLLLKKQDTPDSLIKPNLPEGAQIRENQIAKDGYFEYQSVITVPGKQIFLVIKTSGSSDLEKSKSLIPLLAEKIYWAVIKM